MATAEGTIQFAYDLATPAEDAVLDADVYRGIGAWRSLLQRTNLIGQHPERYDGFGYGNLSGRSPQTHEGFVITASQTSGKKRYRPRDLVQITGFNLQRFWVDAEGHAPPSSETLTHAMIYAADAHINWVFHVHCPEIWRHAEALNLPTTAADVGYGSLEMVSAVAELLSANRSRPLAFATLGHEDGIFSCGPTPRDAGGLLLAYLAKALELEVDVHT